MSVRWAVIVASVIVNDLNFTILCNFFWRKLWFCIFTASLPCRTRQPRIVREHTDSRHMIRMASVDFEVEDGFASRTLSSCRERGMAVERSDDLIELQFSGGDPGVAGFGEERMIGGDSECFLGAAIECQIPDRRIPMPDRAGHDAHPRPRFPRIHMARPNRQNRRLARQPYLMQPDIDRATNRRSRPLQPTQRTNHRQFRNAAIRLRHLQINRPTQQPSDIRAVRIANDVLRGNQFLQRSIGVLAIRIHAGTKRCQARVRNFLLVPNLRLSR